MASTRLPFYIWNSVLVAVCFSIAQGCVERERVALLDFKKSFASFSQNYAKLPSWNVSSSEECCGWEGITCDNSGVHVVQVDLRDQVLESHHLRPSLLELQHLTDLYLSGNNFSMKIPNFIGSFRELQDLDLSNAGFFGTVPPQLANLSNLDSLFLSGVDFSEAIITKIPLLTYFICDSCSFPPPYMLPTTHFNSSSSQLQSLVISDSLMSSSTLSFFLNTANNLSNINLDSVHLEGPSPNTFGQIANLCNLESLSIHQCSIEHDISRVLQSLGAGCASDSMKYLDLSSNNFTGFIPPMLKFHSLLELALDGNQVKGFASHISANYNTTGLLLNTHPSHIFPPTLTTLSISNNALTGVFLSEYFANVSNLNHLELSDNPKLTLSFSHPPSEIYSLYLRSCNLGPGFPTWLLASPLTQIRYLDISNSSLSGSVPTIFWRNLQPCLLYLNLSSNNLVSLLPNLQTLSVSDQTYELPLYIDLSSNGFYGPLPLLFLEAVELYVSKNNFSSFSPLPYPNNFTALDDVEFNGPPMARALDISNNNLSGEIPDWAWLAISSFNSINLSNNNLSGEVPSSTITDLYVLNLSNNKFVGQIPSFLKNSTSMRLLDLSRNRFSGLLTSWIGDGLKNLVVLSIESNNFTGTLPRNLCQLSSLQILDLSHNKLSGVIPSCVNNLVAMAQDMNVSSDIINIFLREGDSKVYAPIIEARFYQALIKWKGMDRLFKKNLELLNLIDLSYNNLSGEIPGELMSLIKLDSLDLSSNNFIGGIPSQIWQLKNLEYLNLSFNNISGSIPSGLADISTLSVLDVSHNKLSGRIPKGNQLQTFDSSYFTANSGLCGEPLKVKCPGDDDNSTQLLHPSPATTNGGDEWEEKQWFYVGSGAGFACGFLGIIATLTWIKEWRYAFFKFSTEIGQWMLLIVALGASRISRKLCFK